VRQAATKHNSVDSLDDQVGLSSAAFGGGPATSDLAVTGLAVLGAGEAAQGPTAAAIANALHNALGVRVRDLPLTPERIVRAME